MVRFDDEAAGEQALRISIACGLIARRSRLCLRV
jgi:hypothetical protein